MTEHSETIPGERASRTQVVQQHARTAECDGFHGRCPAPAELDAARSEVRDLREKLRVVIDETPPELRYDWADQYLQEGPGADA